MTLERQEEFLLSTAFAMEKYAALMKRPTAIFSVGIDTIMAGVDATTYAIMFAVFTFLFIVSSINERRQHSSERNSMWQLLLALFPSNGTYWKYQFGVTRKVLMATCGFGVLVLSSLYQAKLSQQLMIPMSPPAVTLKNIENYVLFDNARLLYTFENSPVMQYVAKMSPVLNNSMMNTQPIFEPNNSKVLDRLQSNVIAIYPETILLKMLADIPSNECANYIFITFDEWTRMMFSLIMRKERVDILESMNAIVAERMSYVDDHIQSFQMGDACRKHIFPVRIPDPIYAPMLLREFSGAFALLFLLLFVSLASLVVEIIVSWNTKTQITNRQQDELATFVIPRIVVDSSMTDEKRNILYAHYVGILKVIGTNEHLNNF
jgi:hypothetical protein